MGSTPPRADDPQHGEASANQNAPESLRGDVLDYAQNVGDLLLELLDRSVRAWERTANAAEREAESAGRAESHLRDLVDLVNSLPNEIERRGMGSGTDLSGVERALDRLSDVISELPRRTTPARARPVTQPTRVTADTLAVLRARTGGES